MPRGNGSGSVPGEVVGRVVELVRYPVKSMAGERLCEVEVDWQGMEGDRQYAFLRRGNTTRFPWLTARDAADLLLHRAEYLDPTTPRTSPVRVSGPDRTSWDLRDPELAEALERISGMDLDLLQLGIGAYDSMPLSIVTTASLQELEERHGARVDNRSLRANIIIDGAISERTMDGRRLIVGNAGGAQLLATYLAPRCSMVTIDPSTAERDPRVMRTIVQHFEGTFAMYASVACPGMLRVGDEVRVVEA